MCLQINAYMISFDSFESSISWLVGSRFQQMEKELTLYFLLNKG